MTTRVWELISEAKAEKNPQESLKIFEKALEQARYSQDSSLIAACLLEMVPLCNVMELHARAGECLSESEMLARELPPDPRTGALLSKLAGILRNRGEYRKSLQLLERAVPLFENALEKAAIYCNMGNCYFEMNEYRKALSLYVKARRVFKNHPYQRGICLQNIGNALREMNKFRKALQFYEEAYAIFSHNKRPVESAHVLWNEAIVYDECEQFERALASYDEALSLIEKEDPCDRAKILNDKGMTLRKLTRYQESLDLLQEALSLFKKYNMPVEAIETKRNIAGLKRNLNLHEEALHDLYSALEDLNAMGKPDSVADVEWEIANVYASADQPSKAITYYDKVSEYYRSTKKDIFRAKVMRDKAAVLKDVGESDQALDLYFQAEKVFKDNGLPAELASTMVNRGNLYRMLNLFKEAQYLFERAKALYREAGMDVHVADAEFNRAAVLAHLSLYDDALSAFKEVEDVYLQHNQPVSVAETQINEAVILGELGRDEEAFSAFERARNLLKGEMVSHQLLIDLNESALLLERGQYEALDVLQKVGGKAVDMGEFTIAYKAYWALGHACGKRGQLKKGYHYLRKCLALTEKIREDISPTLLRMSFFSGIEDIYGEAAFLTHKMGMECTAFSLLQKMKARTLTEQMNAAWRAVQLSGIPSRISAFSSTLLRESAAEKIDETLQKITGLEEEYTGTVTRTELFQDRVRVHLPQVKMIQGQLSREEALIEYGVEDDLLLFLVTPSTFRSFFIPLESGLESTLYEYLLHLRLRHPVERFSRALYELLVAPVEPYLKDKSILHVVPHKSLCLFPFHALEHEKFLAETCQFVYHPTSAVRREIPSGGKVLVLGNPEELPGIEEECETISALAKEGGREAVMLLREDATKERFCELYPDFDVIHLACHGVYNSFNPLRSGVRLHDGILTALEMHQLDLRRKLVILAACGSGSVSVEGASELLGMTRALLCAGGFTITSLWKVVDIASVPFWKVFYGSLFEERSIPSALQKAQLSMISGAFHHPYFWAGYRIMG